MRIAQKILVAFMMLQVSFACADLYFSKQCGNVHQTECRSTCYEDLLYCSPPHVPYSFMYTKPVYHSIESQLAIWHRSLSDYCSNEKSAFQAIFYYQRSMNSRHVDRFFLFNNENILTVKGDAAVTPAAGQLNSNLRDIRAEWLFINPATGPNNFSGSFTVKPEQEQMCLFLEWKTDLANFSDNEFVDRFWFGISVPLQIVKNNIRIEQFLVQNSPNNFPTNIIQAFNNPTLKYARFNPETIKESGAAEIDFKLGTKLLDKDGFEIGFYSTFFVPLHTNAKADYVFSPMVGNNRHFGVGSALFLQMPMNQNLCDYEASFVFEVSNIYLFQNSQYRTLDIKGKPWSRYVLLAKNNGQKNVPASKVLTRKVHVKPYNIVEAVGAFRFARGCFEWEFGYHVWARGREHITFTKPFQEKYGIMGNGALVPGSNAYATASRSTIYHLAPNDVDIFTGNATFIPIKENDVERETGAAPAGISHRGYVTFGAMRDGVCIDVFGNVGGYVEIPQYNTSLPCWGLWAKVGARI